MAVSAITRCAAAAAPPSMLTDMADVSAEIYQLPYLVLGATVVSSQLWAREDKVSQHCFPSPLNKSLLCHINLKPSLIRVDCQVFLTGKAGLL